MHTTPLTLFGMGGGGGKAPYQFFPYNLYKQELVPKNFLLLVLILLPHWCKILRSYLVPLKKFSFSGQIIIKLRLW